MMGMKIIPALILVGGLSSCQALTDFVTGSLAQEQQEQLLAYQDEIATLEQMIRQVEQEAEATLQTAVVQAKAGAAEDLGLYAGQLLELQEKHEELVGKYVSTVGEERKMLDAAFKQRADGVISLVAPLIPAPVQPLVPFASTLLVLIASSRARRHTGRAMKALAKGNLGEMGAYLLKAAGAKHSSPGSKAAADAEDQIA
jgi:hypothetical protein